jgi:rubrerythrin
MSIEQAKTLEILEYAIQMEKDGKAFYLKSAQESYHEMGKQLFKTLAEEEDKHRATFEKIYRAISERKSWPVTDFHADRGYTLKTIFKQASSEPGTGAASELDAIKTAIGMEEKSYSLYNSQANIAANATEKGFFEALAGEERGHQLALVDYFEFLKDPSGFFVNKEHTSLDGA